MTQGQTETLEGYVKSLTTWNAKHNLVSRADLQNLWRKHILHSVAPLIQFSLPSQLRVLDIGSGGGLPGIPLAIMRPDFQVTLVDSIRKKTDSLRAIVRETNLENVTVVNDRAENLARTPRFLSAFDVTMARAVAPLADLIKWSTPLLKKRDPKREQLLTNAVGPKRELVPPLVLALKGGDLSREIAEAARRFRSLKCEEFDLGLEEADETGLADKKVVVVQF